MLEKIIKCPVCGKPYEVYPMYAGDQSSCPECRKTAKMQVNGRLLTDKERAEVRSDVWKDSTSEVKPCPLLEAWNPRPIVNSLTAQIQQLAAYVLDLETQVKPYPEQEKCCRCGRQAGLGWEPGNL